MKISMPKDDMQNREEFHIFRFQRYEGDSVYSVAIRPKPEEGRRAGFPLTLKIYLSNQVNINISSIQNITG